MRAEKQWWRSMLLAVCLLAPGPVVAAPAGETSAASGDATQVRRKRRKRVRRKRRPIKRKRRPAPVDEVSSAPVEGAFTYNLDVFMVEGKAMGGVRLGGYKGSIGLDVSGNLIWLTESDPSGVVDDFVGALVGFHLYGRPVRSRSLELRVGTGLDIYPLFGINADEVLYSWPVFVEGRFWMSDQWGVGAQLRFNLLHSDGLEPGVDRNGAESLPFMLVLSLGGRS